VAGETAFLHLKKTVRGAGRTLRGRSPELARQEAWALLLVHNTIAGMAARAAAAAGTSLAAVCFTAVLALVRDHVTADARCPRCGHRPASAASPPGPLTTAITAQPLARENRKRTSGRTKNGARETPNRGSHLRHHHQPLEPTQSRQKSQNLRAVVFGPGQ
jgi:hypothetical protein